MGLLAAPGDNGALTAGFGPNLAWCQINMYYYLVALFVHCFLSPLDIATELYDSGATELRQHAGWMAAVLARNLVLGIGVYSLWHHLMYVKFSVPLSEKFNPKLPPEAQHWRGPPVSLLRLLASDSHPLCSFRPVLVDVGVHDRLAV